MYLTFLKAVITGLILSIPFGPVGIYCMEKTMVKGQKKGFVAAMGMVTVDVIYGLIALMFITSVEGYIDKYNLLLQVVVAIFLILIGVKKLLKRVKLQEFEQTSIGLIKDYFKTFFLAAANISGVLTIFFTFTTLKIYSGGKLETAIPVSLGILLGGGTEWFCTTYILSHFTKVLNENTIVKLSKILGGIILIFGVCFFIVSTITIIKQLQ